MDPEMGEEVKKIVLSHQIFQATIGKT